jgi:hypothetical protein
MKHELRIAASRRYALNQLALETDFGQRQYAGAD